MGFASVEQQALPAAQGEGQSIDAKTVSPGARFFATKRSSFCPAEMSGRLATCALGQVAKDDCLSAIARAQAKPEAQAH